MERSLKNTTEPVAWASFEMVKLAHAGGDFDVAREFATRLKGSAVLTEEPWKSRYVAFADAYLKTFGP